MTRNLINKLIAPRNVWEAGESWTLTDQPHLHVQPERMPPGRAERRHLHGAVLARLSSWSSRQPRRAGTGSISIAPDGAPVPGGDGRGH